MSRQKRAEPDPDLCFVGDPIAITEAFARWPLRYKSSKAKLADVIVDDKKIIQAKRHYSQAMVDGVKFNIGDDVYVTSEMGKKNYIARIVEFFEAINGEPYFRGRWFYYPEDIVIKFHDNHVQPNRVFLSNVHDDNLLTCIYSGVNVVKVPAKIVLGVDETVISSCDFYYNMKFEPEHLTFSSANDVPETSSSTVPDYAMSYRDGRSKKPFGRLWWDEIIKTVVTRAEPHNQIVLHPTQDRVLTVRENARLQGFPDSYKLCGTVKQQYIQVGNAVAVPIGVTLGYAFGVASQGKCTDEPVVCLPFKYPDCMESKMAEEHSA